MARKTKAYTSKTTESTSPAKVLTLVEKNLVQHFLKHLVGVDESSCKSSAVHHGFSIHAHARRRPAHNQTDPQVQQKYLLEIFPSILCATKKKEREKNDDEKLLGSFSFIKLQVL